MGSKQSTTYRDLTGPEYARASPSDAGVYNGKTVTTINEDGTTRDNIRHGQGQCIYSDGSVYDG